MSGGPDKKGQLVDQDDEDDENGEAESQGSSSAVEPPKDADTQRLTFAADHSAAAAAAATPAPSGSFRRHELTVDDMVEHIGFGRFNVLLFVLCGLPWAADAMEMILLSFLGPSLRCEWNLSPMEEAEISIAVFIGMFFGSFTWGFICDKRGRRIGFLACTLLTGIFGLLSAASPNLGTMLVLRALVGFGVAAGPVCFSLFAELVPRKQRARYLELFELFWTAGVIVEVALAWLLFETSGSSGSSWRILLVITSLPLLALSLLYRWLPESPRYLLVSGQYDHAVEILTAAAAMNGASLPADSVLIRQLPIDTSKKGNLVDLFRPRALRLTLPTLFLWFVNTFVYYGVILMTAVILTAAAAASSSSSSSSSSAPQDSCASSQSMNTEVYADTLIASLGEAPGLLGSILLLDKIGRRRTLSLELVLCGFFTLLLLAFSNSSSMQTLLLFCARAAIFGSFSVIYLYTPEVYPTSLRTTALGTCLGFARFGAIASPLVAYSKAPLVSILLIYGLFALAAAAVSLLLPVESAGRGLQERAIQIPPAHHHNNNGSSNRNSNRGSLRIRNDGSFRMDRGSPQKPETEAHSSEVDSSATNSTEMSVLEVTTEGIDLHPDDLEQVQLI